MVKHVWTVLCRMSILDKGTNNISMVECLEKLTLKAQLPVTVPIAFEIITLWCRTNIEEPVRGFSKIDFVSPSGHKISEIAKTDVDLTTFIRMRTRIHQAGLKIEEFGLHNFVVNYKDIDSDDWKEVTSVPIEITGN